MSQNNRDPSRADIQKYTTTDFTGKRPKYIAFTGRARTYLVKVAVLISPIIYLFLWNMVIRHGFPSILKQFLRVISFSSSANWANVQVAAYPEVVVWRMKVIPIYWSRVGNLSPYHTLFSLFYLVYVSNSIVKIGRMKMGGMKNFRLKKIGNIVNFGNVKKFWIVFGVIAFLTTSFSTFPFFSDLFVLAYYFAYLVSFAVAPISLYLFWKKRKRN